MTDSSFHDTIIPQAVSERADELAAADDSPFARAFRATSAALDVLYGGPHLQRDRMRGASR